MDNNQSLKRQRLDNDAIDIARDLQIPDIYARIVVNIIDGMSTHEACESVGLKPYELDIQLFRDDGLMNVMHTVRQISAARMWDVQIELAKQYKTSDKVPEGVKHHHNVAKHNFSIYAPELASQHALNMKQHKRVDGAMKSDKLAGNEIMTLESSEHKEQIYSASEIEQSRRNLVNAGSDMSD